MAYSRPFRLDLNWTVATLPLGARQVVEIARALSEGTDASPRIVVLDKPTSSLDGQLATGLLKHVRRFIEAGGSAVFISHKLGEVLDVSDRVLVMRDGAVVAEARRGTISRRGEVTGLGGLTGHGHIPPIIAPLSSGPLVLSLASGSELTRLASAPDLRSSSPSTIAARPAPKRRGRTN